MAIIKPFFCIRPAEGKAAVIAALPYDVYNRNEAKAVVDKNPESFLAIDRAETMLEPEIDLYDDRVYAKAHDLLWERIRNGAFQKEVQKCFYVYELTMNGRVQTGIAACASIDDYINNRIRKHENTRENKEIDRIRHVDTCNAQTGPIFLAYRAQSVIRSIVAEIKKTQPLYDFVSDDGIRHRVFQISEQTQILDIEHAFSQMDALYIADGHHRAASAVKVGLKRRENNPNHTGEEEYNYFLSVLFPDEELMIMDYNRTVKDLNGYSTEEFLGKVQDIFDVELLKEQKKPEKKGEISMFLADQWYSLRIREQNFTKDPVEGLDVSLLQSLLLEPVLGIMDPKISDRIDFVGGIRGLDELERRVKDDCKVAFAMYPTSISELFEVADAGLLMPPKSTWFEPKLRSGLFIHEI